jgi:adenosylcobinamide-phosphate synthase
MIVGRDTSRLDESGISRAALESLAENTADGVVAPALWYALLGLPGLVLYKAINTADSMIGHKTERHLHFGWAAARLDDLVNLPASRLTGALFAAAAWITSKEHAEKAWHEGTMIDLPWMGEGRSDLTRQDIRRGLRLYGRALSLFFAALLVISLF